MSGTVVPSPAPSAITARAVSTGAVLSCFLAFASPYTVFLLHTAGMSADFITAGAIFLFFILTGLLNAGVAQGKSRSGLNWFLLSLLLGPIATFLLVAFFDDRRGAL